MTIDETASQIVNIAWAEFIKSVGEPLMPLHPDMRALMMTLVTSGMKVEREACANVALEWTKRGTGDPYTALWIANEIRARSEEKGVKK